MSCKTGQVKQEWSADISRDSSKKYFVLDPQAFIMQYWFLATAA